MASLLLHRSSFLNPRRLLASLLVLLCTAITTAAWADPPGRVGRLGDMNGQVWFFSPDAGEWVSAVRNRPLTDGDRVSTDDGARAEVRIGSSTVRLDSGTELEVLRIDDDHISLQLHSGSIAARLRSSESAREFELRTGEGRFTTPRAGRYRFDRADDASHVTVLSGSAVFEGPGSALTVNTGQRAEFWLENNAAQYSITDPVHDSFASWSAEQDRRDDRSASARYVSPEMTGAEDLDRYGRWEQEPEYGPVWIPRAVPVGWAPYRAGHWAWVSPWGWTWIDDQPWGFAPFHYGRWVTVQDRWCWVPGTYVRRPVYAPALVGWVGGPHLSVSISVGNTAPAVGWFPLAPREVYVPAYRVSPTYVRQVNVTQVTNITNITTIVNNPQQAVVNVDYRNRHLPHAVTVVPQTVLVNRQPVAPAVIPWHQERAIAGPVTLPANLQPQQQQVVAAPPVPAPKVDETRRRHGFSPDGQRPAFAATSPQSPATSANLAAPAGGINIPLPPNRANAAQGRGGPDGEARARFERGHREGRDDGRVQTLPAQVQKPALAGQPAAVPGQSPQGDAARQQQEAAMRAEQQRLMEGKRQQEAQQRQQQDAQRAQEAQRQQQEAAAARTEQQRLLEGRRQQDAQQRLQQDAHRAQEAQRQQQEAQRAQETQRQQQEAAMRAEQQRQMEARRQQDAQRQQQQEAAARMEQQRQAEARRQQELQQRQQEAQRQQEQRARFATQQQQQAQAQPQAARPPVEQKAVKPEPVQSAQERQQAKEERQKEQGHQRGEKREAN